MKKKKHIVGPLVIGVHFIGADACRQPIAFIRKVMDGRVGLPGATFAAFHMPCGKIHEYKREADFPRTSTPCKCGNPAHWVVLYEKQEGKIMGKPKTQIPTKTGKK